MKIFFNCFKVACIVVIVFSITSFNIESSSKKPEAILFMLNHSINVIESMKIRGMSEEKIQDVKDMDDEINTSIMNDFANNFTFCPVYFFYNDQRDYVQQKQWEMVDFINPKTFHKGTNPDFSAINNYLIAEVNYPPITEYDTIKSHIIYYGGDEPVTKTHDNGILLYDSEFNLIKSKIRYTSCSLTRKGNMLKPRSLKYNFKGATKFQIRLNKFFN